MVRTGRSHRSSCNHRVGPPHTKTLCGTRTDCDMNHKRKRPKQLRAGCLLCKPNKLGKGMEKKLGHRGFGKLRQEAAARQDLSDAT